MAFFIFLDDFIPNNHPARLTKVEIEFRFVAIGPNIQKLWNQLEMSKVGPST